MLITCIHYPNLVELLGKGWTESELCRIHNIHARRFQITLPDSTNPGRFTIRRLKELLEDIHALEADALTVRLRGRVLEDGECLASCCIMNGTTLLLGLIGTPDDTKKADSSAPETMSTKAAIARQSETMTIASDDASRGPGDAQGSTAASGSSSAEPWWQGSRLSGPRGGGQSSGTWSTPGTQAPGVSDASAASTSGGATDAAAATSAAGSNGGGAAVEGPSAEEMRRRRLARFG
eukprot:TRINITY_DN38662_c0_g1_i1.p1 TRINITY_DN38662_c0_g1~~TRINITY_DN38662_c0_g1_i1.p1  ORF type:complete len:236 (-),score=46.99 TRINITY_DN38662_c0_g1_i1:455-1162(-)